MNKIYKVIITACIILSAIGFLVKYFGLSIIDYFMSIGMLKLFILGFFSSIVIMDSGSDLQDISSILALIIILIYVLKYIARAIGSKQKNKDV